MLCIPWIKYYLLTQNIIVAMRTNNLWGIVTYLLPDAECVFDFCICAVREGREEEAGLGIPSSQLSLPSLTLSF